MNEEKRPYFTDDFIEWCILGSIYESCRMQSARQGLLLTRMQFCEQPMQLFLSPLMAARAFRLGIETLPMVPGAKAELRRNRG